MAAARMKTVFCALAAAAMGMAGCAVGSVYRDRARLLKQLLTELEALESRIRAGHPVCDALNQPDMKLLQPMAKDIAAQGIYAAWLRLSATESFAAMEETERAELDGLWADMGMLDLQRQLNRFAQVRRQMQKLLEEAERDAAQHSRLFMSLGVLAGLAVAVLMW